MTTGLTESSGRRVQRIWQEAWAMYEALRRLGFADDDIAAVVAAGTVHVVLDTQNKKFVCTVGQLDQQYEEAADQWKTLRAWIADGTLTDAELRRMWFDSVVGSHNGGVFAEIAMKLKQMGFVLPALVN
jgi:hypothetical protein